VITKDLLLGSGVLESDFALADHHVYLGRRSAAPANTILALVKASRKLR
jgi:hypothetical protein